MLTRKKVTATPSQAIMIGETVTIRANSDTILTVVHPAEVIVRPSDKPVDGSQSRIKEHRFPFLDTMPDF